MMIGPGLRSESLVTERQYLFMPVQCKRARGQLTCWASNNRSRRRNAKKPGLFEVQVITPPKESLGIHAFPPNTHNGDRIEVDGKDFVVSSLSKHYKLVKGKYEIEHNRLNVQGMSRYFTNLHLEGLLEGSKEGRQ